MTREERRDVFEAIGLVAIVASLIFLALEVRQANLSTRLVARDQATQGVIDQMGDIIDTQVLSIAYQKSGTDDPLTDLEANQLRIYYLRRWWNFERIFYLHRAGVISDQEWNGFNNAITLSLTDSSPFWVRSQAAWKTARTVLSEEFVHYVDTEIKLIE